MDRALSLPLPRSRRAGVLSRLIGLMAFDRSRRRLGELDDHLLDDIGMTRAEARLEGERPLWHAPDHWLR